MRPQQPRWPWDKGNHRDTHGHAHRRTPKWPPHVAAQHARIAGKKLRRRVFGLVRKKENEPVPKLGSEQAKEQWPLQRTRYEGKGRAYFYQFPHAAKQALERMALIYSEEGRPVRIECSKLEAAYVFVLAAIAKFGKPATRMVSIHLPEKEALRAMNEKHDIYWTPEKARDVLRPFVDNESQLGHMISKYFVHWGDKLRLRTTIRGIACYPHDREKRQHGHGKAKEQKPDQLTAYLNEMNHPVEWKGIDLVLATQN